MKHLILTGFMGSGKTTIGTLLASQLKLPFVDSDLALAEKTGLKPQFYIPRFGLEAFRRLEKQFLRKILSGPPIILSTGGGAVLDSANRRLLLSKGQVFWLHTPLPLLLTRLREKSARPLLPKPFSLSQLRCLFNEREPFYRQCHYKISNGLDGPKEVAFQIIQKYNQPSSEHASRPFK